ncbi:MAG: hypothetical protein ACJ758_08075 [Actinomycetota bacterium]
MERNARRLSWLVPLACLALLATAAPAWATISSSPLPSKWGTNGRVWATLRVGDVAYLGGEFSAMIPSTPGQDPLPAHNLAAIDVYTGELLPWAPDVDGPVYSLASNGRSIFVGGSFSAVDAQPRESFAAVGLNGTLRPWTDDVAGRVRSLVVSGTELYLGGRFKAVAASTRHGLAALDLTTTPRGALLPWDPSVNRSVRSLAPMADGSVVIGGVFTSVDGDSGQRHVSKVQPDGSVDETWAAHPDRQVWSVATSGDLVVVGLGGEPGGRLDAYDLSGNPAWSIDADGDVQSVTFDGGEVIAGGHYGFIDGVNVPKLSAFDTAGALDTAWRPRPNSAKGIWSVSPSPDVLLVGGDFTMIGSAAYNRFAEFQVA